MLHMFLFYVGIYVSDDVDKNTTNYSKFKIGLFDYNFIALKILIFEWFAVPSIYTL